MLARWFRKKNWGDDLNPILIKYISGEYPKWVKLYKRRDFLQSKYSEPVYVVIGSILANSSDRNAIIWGTGFLRFTDKVRWKPKKVCAVRGPLTRLKLLEQGIKCPKIYGDPALLYPKFYTPDMKKKYILGIIPHYVDRDNTFIENFSGISDVKIIDITDDINNVVKDICSCKKIASSSLHGIIAADAYGIPSVRIKFSDKVLGRGFKFIDYFMSVGRCYREPLIVQKDTTLKDILREFHNYKINIDLNKLWDTCPFRKNNDYSRF
ncbi:MAG: polysaccharide pyruvyl transferase family protein [Candidatus Cloacimonetes bacterium]|nr:polysaccharide pyruvyl transferase family protein [Candidatus Cloacimonadota bacterium]